MKSGFLLLVLALSACALQRGRITTRAGTVTAVKDAGKPATQSLSQQDTSVPIPAGTLVEIVETEATAEAPKSWRFKFTPTEATSFTSASSSTNASTGVVDTSIRKHEIDIESKKPLLYASLVSAAFGGVMLYKVYPTPAAISFGAAVVFFLAWKISDLPSWFYVVGVAAVVGAAMLWRGHEKGEAYAKQESTSVSTVSRSTSSTDAKVTL